MGAGPFTLTSYVPDSHANLVRNPGYWDASQIHLANFTVQSITQPEQILSALQSGQVNVAYIAGNQVAAAKAAGFKIAVIPSEVVNELDIQTATAPFNNPKVVEAINYAINRQAILQVQAAGYGAVAYQPFPEGLRRLQRQARQPVPVQPGPGQAAARAGRLRRGPEDHADHDQHRRLARRADPGPARSRSASRSPSRTSRPTPRPSSSTSTRRIPLAVDGTAGPHVAGGDARRPLQPAGPDERERQGADHAARGGAARWPKALTVPLDSPGYPAALQNAVETAVQQEPIHIWLYTNPRIFAYSPTVTGIPSDLVQQRWEGVRVAAADRWQS